MQRSAVRIGVAAAIPLLFLAAILGLGPRPPGPPADPTSAPAFPPITRQNAELAITLSSFLTGLPKPAGCQAGPEDNVWNRLTFRVASGSRSLTDWEPASISFRDATGRIWTPEYCFLSRSKKADGFYFVAPAGSGPPPWGLRVEFTRSSQARFSPAELWRVRRAIYPKRGFQPAHARAIRLGVPVSLRGISRPEEHGTPTMPGALLYPALHLGLSTPSTGLWVTLVRATDQRGRDIARPEQRAELSRTVRLVMGSAIILLDPPAGVSHLDLTFAIQGGRAVEFLVARSR